MKLTKVVKLTKEQNGSFKFGFPKAWEEIVDLDGFIHAKIGEFTYPLTFNSNYRACLPKPMLKYYGIDGTTSIKLELDIVTKELDVTLYFNPTI